MTNSEKENKAKLSKEEVKNLVEMLRYLMDAYGLFAEKLGKIQKSHKEAFDSMFSLESAEKLPEVMSMIVEKAPEMGKLYTSIFIRMMTVMPRINKLMTLSADEKIKLGESLKTLAKDLDKLLEWIDKMEEK
ncbi:MAG: hypothetical protein NWE91_03340 [Candidatus Bathyarchaeota archaeon]|nr:hypothetical protein [Candidatus Bathyarchaeota archaeon]